MKWDRYQSEDIKTMVLPVRVDHAFPGELAMLSLMGEVQQLSHSKTGEALPEHIAKVRHATITVYTRPCETEEEAQERFRMLLHRLAEELVRATAPQEE